MEERSQQKYGIKASLIQIGLCFVVSIAQLGSGMTMGFSAVTLPFMQQNSSYIHITSNEASWIAGLAAISQPFGCLISGPILDRWGRKAGLLLLNLPTFIGWLLIAVQPNITRIYAGRILTGLASGLSSVPATVYFAEVSTKSLRGLLINCTSVSISTGVLIVYTLGYFLKEDWRTIALICSVFPVAAAVLIALLVPESPQWLLSKGRNKKASKSLKILRGVPLSDGVQQELELMSDPNKSNRRHKIKLKEIIYSFAKPQVYKPFIIMNVFFFLQQFSGIFVIVFYAVDVVRSCGITFDPFIVSIIIAIIRLIFTILGAGLSKQYGRRPLAIFSGVGMTISLFVLTWHLHQQKNQLGINSSGVNETEAAAVHFGNASELNVTDTTTTTTTTIDTATDLASISWVPLISMLFYVLSSTVGFLTLPWAMIGEVFPSQVRGVAGGLTTCLAYIASFATVKSYPYLSEVLHNSGVFTIYCVMALIGAIFVIFFLPETQGKTLQEIERYFTRTGKNARSDLGTEQSLENKIMLSTVKIPQIVPQEKT